MSLRLIFLPQAERDLDDIYDLIAEDSPRAAIRFVDDIRRRCEALSDFPRMGRQVDVDAYHLTFDRKVRVRYLLMDDEVRVSQVRYLGQQ